MATSFTQIAGLKVEPNVVFVDSAITAESTFFL